MKTFNRTDLPESIEHNGETYTRNRDISIGMNLNDTDIKIIQETLKKEGRKAILVKVLSKILRGKLDIHNKPYEPTKWIYTNK